MKLVPWRRSDLARPWPTLRNEVHRLFDDFFNSEFFTEPFRGLTEWSPALDLSETEEAIVVKAELPGIGPDNVKVLLQDDILTIKGEKKEERNEKTQNVHRVERSYGRFERSFRLQSTVKSDKVDAKFTNGVLTVTLPKAEEVKPKAVKIKIE